MSKGSQSKWSLLHADSDDPLGPERLLAKAVLYQAIMDKDWEFLSTKSLWHDLAGVDPMTIQIGVDPMVTQRAAADSGFQHQ